MSSNMKLNWANSSSIKPWRPHGRKMSILSLKSKILNILNMDVKYLYDKLGFLKQMAKLVCHLEL
jgi:hypothetical protein